ncbi:MAG: flagellar basal body rod protein FlgB [Thermoleophilaceae bacterium]
MNLFDNTELGLQRAISGAAMRQTVLANNLANANTPGYQRMDLNFHGALARAMQSEDSAAIDSVGFTAERAPQRLRADGNGVDVDVESAELSKNGLDYQSLVSVARARIEIMQSAMGVK